MQIENNLPAVNAVTEHDVRKMYAERRVSIGENSALLISEAQRMVGEAMQEYRKKDSSESRATLLFRSQIYANCSAGLALLSNDAAVVAAALIETAMATQPTPEEQNNGS